jgi:hypothetical protein
MLQSLQLTYNPHGWHPEQIQVLDLSNQGLRVLHMAGLVNLRELNLANNALESVADSGLCGCTALANLVMPNNRVNGDASMRYFRLLPSLIALDLRGNPIMEPTQAR